MPTYQYRCKDLGHELEIVQSFTDDPLETCPECGGQLKKVYGSVGISFKGSGFYKTDSRGSKKAASSGSSSSDNQSGDNKSSDSKSSDNKSSDSKSSDSGSSKSDSSSSSGSSSDKSASTSKSSSKSD